MGLTGPASFRVFSGNLNDVNALKSGGQDVLWSKICLVWLPITVCVHMATSITHAGSYAACGARGRRNVATIGVHGVGNQPPFAASRRRTAALCRNLNVGRPCLR